MADGMRTVLMRQSAAKWNDCGQGGSIVSEMEEPSE